jgi:hypothetical protein
VIWHPSEARVLRLESGLPELVSGEYVFSAANHVQSQVRAAFDLEVFVLRRFAFEADTVNNRARMVFELLLAGDSENIPSGAVWSTVSELSNLNLEHRQLVITVFEQAANPSDLRPAWVKRGWWSEVFFWVDSILEPIGVSRTGFAQVKTWQISSLSKFETSLGTLFFKAVPPYMIREVAVTAWLAQHFPICSPEILAVNLERGWLLLREFPGAELSKDTPLELVANALTNYAKLQIASIPHTTELMALGCMDRSLEVLAGHIHELLNDEQMWVRAEQDGFTGEQITRLRSFESEFLRRCETLAALGIPNTLEHGDIWQNNVFIADTRSIFYDWSDAAIAFSLQSVNLAGLEPETWGEGAKDVLIDAYLEPWTDFAPLPELRTAFLLLQPLAELHTAISYHRFILPNVEDKSEWYSALNWHLKATLKWMDDKQ